MHLHQEMESFYLGTLDASVDAYSYSTEGITMTEGTKHGVKGTMIPTSTEPRIVLLILEDFDEIRAFLANHFSKRGFDVFSSATLRDALAIAWEEDPRVIIIDYDLSGEIALHSIKRLHDARPESCILLVGGPQTLEVEEQAILAGATKVLSKSYEISEMDRAVKDAVNRFSRKPQLFSRGIV